MILAEHLTTILISGLLIIMFYATGQLMSMRNYGIELDKNTIQLQVRDVMPKPESFEEMINKLEKAFGEDLISFQSYDTEIRAEILIGYFSKCMLTIECDEENNQCKLLAKPKYFFSVYRIVECWTVINRLKGEYSRQEIFAS